MLVGLLGSKFSNKCKHSVKCINTRLVPITKKKAAVLRILKKDVADLISRGLDSVAFGRMDALIVEINHAYCYDTIEKYCECVLNQLPCMQKQRECPEDAVEAVSTLIFAAARLSNLPELSDLRRVFSDRYGSHMESSVNSEFVEKLQKESFSMEKKLQLMQGIAQEFSVSWDIEEFKHKMRSPSHGSVDRLKSMVSDGKNEPPGKQINWGNVVVTGAGEKVKSNERIEPAQRIFVQKQEMQPKPRDIHVIPDMNGGRLPDPPSKSRLPDPPSKSRKVFANEPENVEPISEPAPPPYSKLKLNETSTEAHKANQQDETIIPKRQPIGLQVGPQKTRDGKPVYTVPPYTKTNGANIGACKGRDDHQLVRERSSRDEAGSEDGHERQPVRPLNYNHEHVMDKVPPHVKPKVNSVGADHNSTNSGYDGSKVGDDKDPREKDKQRPRSVRSRHPKPPVLDEIDGSVDDERLVSHTPSWQGEQVNKQNADANSEDKYGEKKNKEQRPRGPMDMEKEIEDAIDDSKPMSRAHSDQRRLGDTRATDAYGDDYYDDAKKIGLKGLRDEEHENGIDYGRLMSRTPSSRRRTRYRHRNDPITDDYCGEGKDLDTKAVVVNETDDAIHHVKLMPRNLGGRRRRGSRKTTAYDGHCDEEEKVMDRLLLHYSKKGITDKTSTRTRMPPSDNVVGENEAFMQHNNGRECPGPAKLNQHARAASFSVEPVSVLEVVRRPVRAISVKPDVSTPNTARAHPKMPDYDELAASFAALRKQ